MQLLVRQTLKIILLNNMKYLDGKTLIYAALNDVPTLTSLKHGTNNYKNV